MKFAISTLFTEIRGILWWNPIHIIPNGSKDMACLKTYNLFGPPGTLQASVDM